MPTELQAVAADPAAPQSGIIYFTTNASNTYYRPASATGSTLFFSQVLCQQSVSSTATEVSISIAACSGALYQYATGANLYARLDAQTSGTGIYWSSALARQVPVCDFTPPARRLLQQRRAEYRARSSIKRSLRLLDNFGLESEARIFISGTGNFCVSHPSSRFTFKFARGSRSILDASSKAQRHNIPYELELWTKDDKFISRLCVIVEDTPILDQVLALAIFIRSGDEDYILRKSNYFNRTSDLELLRDVGVYIPKLLP